MNGTLDDFPLEAVAGKGRLAFAFRPVHRLLVAALAEAGSTNLIVKRWDAATRRELSSVVIAGGIGTNSTPDALKDFSNRLSPDGKWLAKTKFFGAALKIHSLVTGPADKLLDTPQMIQGLALFSEGKAAALASNQKTEVKLRKVATGETIATLKGHNLPLLSIVLSPDEDRLATASIGQESVKLWDTKSWQEVADLDPGPGKFLWDPQFLSDGHTLAIRETDFDGSKWIRLWRAPSWDEIHAVEAKEAKRKSTGPHESR